jgi:ribosomal protein S17
MNNEKKGCLVGFVVDNRQRKDGTIKVKISHKHKHPKYNGYIERTKFYFVHLDVKGFKDEEMADNNFLLGKRVSIVPCAPKSKRKRFEFGGLI